MNAVLYCNLCPTVPVRVVDAFLWGQIVHAVVDHDVSLDDIARVHWSDPISGGYRRIMLSAGVWLTVREEAFPVPAFHGPPEPTHLRYKDRLVGWLRTPHTSSACLRRRHGNGRQPIITAGSSGLAEMATL